MGWRTRTRKHTFFPRQGDCASAAASAAAAHPAAQPFVTGSIQSPLYSSSSHTVLGEKDSTGEKEVAFPLKHTELMPPFCCFTRSSLLLRARQSLEYVPRATLNTPPLPCCLLRLSRNPRNTIIVAFFAILALTVRVVGATTHSFYSLKGCTLAWCRGNEAVYRSVVPASQLEKGATCLTCLIHCFYCSF